MDTPDPAGVAYLAMYLTKISRYFRTGASATVSVGFLAAAIPMLYVYKLYGHIYYWGNVVLLLATGFLVSSAQVLEEPSVETEIVTRDLPSGQTKCLD